MKRKNSTGITLIEVIVAIAMFAMVVTPLFGIFSHSIRMETRSVIHSLTTYEAQMKMEEIYGLSADELEGKNRPEHEKRVYYTIEDSIELYYEYEAVPFSPIAEEGDMVDYTRFKFFKVTITVGNELYDVDSTLEVVLNVD